MLADTIQIDALIVLANNNGTTFNFDHEALIVTSNDFPEINRRAFSPKYKFIFVVCPRKMSALNLTETGFSLTLIVGDFHTQDG
ncbi:MAG: hypothetical protein JSS86_21415, partial [Cyanobacteria bacterium SZAS LIN-2]|nr:hypothetical protein [Cyanobacteria bacterium SZAS LIN-2]